MRLIPEKCWHNLYIHIPFCVSKCGYCAFYSETQCGSAIRKNYLAAVKDFLLQQEFSSPVKTVYIGGGTPNFLTASEMAELFEFVYKIVPLAKECEVSCELNPELLTVEKMSVLNEYATRLSLGVQSFDESVRNLLMRKCSSEHLQKALKLLEKRRARHFNIDLIYGVAGVPEKVLANDLSLAVEHGADHLSCYSLTAEENSRLGLNSPVADNSEAADRWLFIGEKLSEYGINRYEISNYAKRDAYCRHNVNVWRGDTLLGLGAAAAGFNGVDRYNFAESIDDFIAGTAPEFDRITPNQRLLEIFAVNLRTVEGWQKNIWEKLYPGSWDKMYKMCKNCAAENPAWWCVENDHIALTGAGLLFWDDAAMDVLSWDEDIL